MELSKETAGQMAEQFVAIASQHGDGPFDYSAPSVILLDQLLDGFHSSGGNPEEMQGTIAVASCYLGEVLRRVAGAEWLNGDEAGDNVPEVMRFPLMMKFEGSLLVPFSKVWKRVENGSEDSLPFYFDVLMKQAGRDEVPRIASSSQFSKKEKLGFMARLFGKKL